MKVALIGDSLTEGRPGISFVTLLSQKYPIITFDNLGKPGETVTSLYTRLSKTKIEREYDLVFLWIGVNDVYSKLLKVKPQPIVKNHYEFAERLGNILDLLSKFTKRIVVVSPALVGEIITNEPNKEVKKLSAIIELTCKDRDLVFLNMHAVFERELKEAKSSDFINVSAMSVMRDALFYKKTAKIDEISEKRGLHITLDGVHLNTKGATLVANEYAIFIEKYL